MDLDKINQATSLLGDVAGWTAVIFGAATFAIAFKDSSRKAQKDTGQPGNFLRIVTRARRIFAFWVDSILSSAIALWTPDQGRMPDPMNTAPHARIFRSLNRFGVRNLPSYRAIFEWPPPALFPPPPRKGPLLLRDSILGMFSVFLLLAVASPILSLVEAIFSLLDPSMPPVSSYLISLVMYSSLLAVVIKSWHAIGWRVLSYSACAAFGFMAALLIIPAATEIFEPFTEHPLNFIVYMAISILLWAPMLPFEDFFRTSQASIRVNRIWRHIRIGIVVATLATWSVLANLLNASNSA